MTILETISALLGRKTSNQEILKWMKNLSSCKNENVRDMLEGLLIIAGGINLRVSDPKFFEKLEKFMENEVKVFDIMIEITLFVSQILGTNGTKVRQEAIRLVRTNTSMSDVKNILYIKAMKVAPDVSEDKILKLAKLVIKVRKKINKLK